MSNIRRFPGAEDDETAMERIKRKENRRRSTRAKKILIVLAVVIVLVALYIYYSKTKKYESYQVVNSVGRTSTGLSDLVNFDNTIMTYSKDGAGAVDATGKLLWNQTFTMQNPIMSMSGDFVAFADYGGSTIYYQYKSGEAGSVSTSMPIRKIAAASGGYVAAVLEDTDVTWIYMYDLNGTEIAYFRTTIEKSGYPLDIAISPNGELVAVSYYYVDVDDTKSSVAFYNFGDVGQNNIDNYVSGYNYVDTIVPLVKFINNEHSFAISPERLCIYGDSHKPMAKADILLNDEVLSVYNGKDAIAIVLRNNSIDNKYRLELYDLQGRKLSEKEFNFDYTGVSFGNEHVIIYGDLHMYIASYTGRMRYEGNYTEPILLMEPTSSEKKYVIVSDNSIDTLELK